MEFELPFINNQITQLISFSAVVVIGIFALLNLIDRSSRSRRDQLDHTNTSLINTLQETVTTLEGKINGLQAEISLYRNEVLKLKTRNATIEEILQGRDKNTLDYQNRGQIAMKKIDSMEMNITANTETLVKIQVNIEKLLKTLDRHLSQAE